MIMTLRSLFQNVVIIFTVIVFFFGYSTREYKRLLGSVNSFLLFANRIASTKPQPFTFSPRPALFAQAKRPLFCKRPRFPPVTRFCGWRPSREVGRPLGRVIWARKLGNAAGDQLCAAGYRVPISCL